MLHITFITRYVSKDIRIHINKYLPVQAKAGKKRRELQRQVLFTMPIRPKAGQTVKVYYNPDVTPLRGRPEAWLRGGWNRWAIIT